MEFAFATNCVPVTGNAKVLLGRAGVYAGVLSQPGKPGHPGALAGILSGSQSLALTAGVLQGSTAGEVLGVVDFPGQGVQISGFAHGQRSKRATRGKSSSRSVPGSPGTKRACRNSARRASSGNFSGPGGRAVRSGSGAGP